MSELEAGSIVVYGAYGYTGCLVVAECRRRGLRPVLSGRDPERLAALAASTDLPSVAVDLGDTDALEALLDGASAVLHCAGPFVRTWEPMVRACLATGTHYLDITGEATVFESLMTLDRPAAEHGVMLLPGVGFDVVPTDCLASHLAGRLPDATRLALAFQTDSGPSRGTALTMLEHADRGGLVRREGLPTAVPIAWKTREIDFGDGPVTTMTIPWGDVITAWHSTRIPEIEVYTRTSPRAVKRLRRLRFARHLLKLGPLRAFLRRRIEGGRPGPSDRRLAEGSTQVWGEVTNDAGEVASGRLTGPQAYRWTAVTAVEAAVRAVGDGARPGYQTPSSAFGAEFVLEAGDGAERIDL